MLALSIAGIAVGLAILITVIHGYIYLSSNDVFYGSVKIGGSLLAHQEFYDEIIIFVAVLLTASSTFLLLKVLLQKKRK